MGQFRSFEEIEAWKEGRQLIRSIRSFCKRDHVRKDFAFVDQITRAARSICSNIAEGNDALTIPDFIKFLGFAKRSAAEVRSHLYDALDEQHISREEFGQFSDQTKKICSMIAKLIHHLQSLNPDLKRTYKEIATVQNE